MSQLTIVAIAVIVPIAIVGSLQVGDVNRALALTRSERVGVTCLSRGYGLLDEVIALEQHRNDELVADVESAFASYARSGCPRTTELSAFSKKTPRNPEAIAKLAREVDHLINAIADATGLTFDSDLVVADMADGSAYALVDALPPLAAAGTSGNRIAVAKSEATAASRLALLNDSDIDPTVQAAPSVANQLRTAQARLKAKVAAYFSRLDRWEGQTLREQSDVLGPMRETFAATHDLFRTMSDVLDERLVQNGSQLEWKRAIVVSTALIVLSFALLIVLLVGRNIMLGHRRELLHLEEVSLKEARFKAIFVSSPQPIAITDSNGNVIECNEAYRILVGVSPRTHESLPLFAPLRSYAPLAIAKLFEPMDGKPSESTNGKFELIRGDDSELCCIATATTIGSLHGDVHYYAVMLSDVTERELNERRLQRQATHDKLTDVANRGYLLSRLERSMSSTDGSPRFALLFIDVDDFKTINDTLGHLAGDACLQTFAHRLRSITRGSDIVARYGGDEFAVLLCDRTSVGMTGEITERVRRELQAPIAFGENVLVVSSSIGVAIDSENMLGPEEAIEAADRAMYIDKASKADRSVSIQNRGVSYSVTTTASK